MGGTRRAAGSSSSLDSTTPVTAREVATIVKGLLDEQLAAFSITIRKEIEAAYEARFRAMEQLIEDQQREIARLSDKNEAVEVLDKLIVYGLEEANLEGSEDFSARSAASLSLAEEFVAEKMKAAGHGDAQGGLKRAYRLGKHASPGKRRPLVLHFRSVHNAEFVLSRKKDVSVREALQASSIWVSEMLTQDEMRRKKALLKDDTFKAAWKAAREAKQPGTFWKRAIPYINKTKWSAEPEEETHSDA